MCCFRFRYFNPRSHERSDDKVAVVVTKVSISIHAPTRGATVTADNITFCDLYFNPRSHERSDKKAGGTACRIYYFNPRSHERSDGVSRNIGDSFSFISIHAPTRGATTPVPLSITALNIFQSTLPREERLFCVCKGGSL